MSTPKCPFLASVTGKGQPINLQVVLTPSEEVQSLRARIKDLEGQITAMRQEVTRAQNLFQAESVLNLELIDLCREHGVPVRQVLKDRKGRG